MAARELAAVETTTVEEVNAHFDAAWLSQTNVAATQSFIASVRNSYPNAVIRDLVALTPTRATAVIDTPGSAAPHGFLTFGTRYSGTKRITSFGVSSYGGNARFVADRTLTLTQAADKFVTFSSAPALLVARIRPNGTCEALVDLRAGSDVELRRGSHHGEPRVVRHPVGHQPHPAAARRNALKTGRCGGSRA